MPIPNIPVRDMEAVKAEAKEKWGGDTEKFATTILTHLNYRGVNLSSRYNKAHEYKTMAEIISCMSPYHASLVESVFCDSKACATYSIQLAPTSRETARVLAETFQYGCFTFGGGHNGIYVHTADEGDIVLDPMWSEYFEDEDDRN